jgi:hypothetical protein
MSSKMPIRALTRRLNAAIASKNTAEAKKLIREYPFEALKASRFVRLEYKPLVEKWATEAVDKISKEGGKAENEHATSG